MAKPPIVLRIPASTPRALILPFPRPAPGATLPATASPPPSPRLLRLPANVLRLDDYRADRPPAA